MTKEKALYNFCLRIGDTNLILGQRMAEWCSKGPYLEEDIALSNIGLDLFGQARTMLSYAAEIEGKGKSEDDLAFHRNEREFFNTLISERPNGHFGDTIVRNFLHDAFFFHFYEALSDSKDEKIAAFAVKSLKEVTYHLRHNSEWVIRLGDGTEESHKKCQESLNTLWAYTGDMFEMNDVDLLLIKEGISVDLKDIKNKWDKTINEILSMASLTRPEDSFMHSGRLNGLHSEHLGHLLSEMQYIPRAYPDAKW